MKIPIYTTAKTLIRFQAIDSITKYNFAYIIDANIESMGRNINNSFKFGKYTPRIYSYQGFEYDSVEFNMGIITNTGN